MTVLDDGAVEIELDGETRRLVPTLQAAQDISRMTGGLLTAVDKVSAYDVNAMAAVVAAGLGAKPKEVAEIEEAVFADLIGIHASVTLFLGVLINGGKPLPKIGEAADDGTPGEA